MLTLELGALDYFDESKGRFVTRKPRKLTLEHSLRSLARWESKWKVPFISDKPKTREQSLDYVSCMCANCSIDEETLSMLTPADMDKINKYIEDSMTATTINRRGPKKPGRREIITAEIIYWWMIQYGIPPEYEKWHLNRLLTLVEVCSAKQATPQKMGKREQLAQQRMLNESRKARLNTKG